MGSGRRRTVEAFCLDRAQVGDLPLAQLEPLQLGAGQLRPDLGPVAERQLDPDLEAALPRFLASRKEALAEMPAALAAGDRDTFKRLAHRLAGSFALYGFKWAATEAKELERDAAEGEADDLATRTEALRAHLDVVKVRVAAKDPVKY